MSSKKSLDSRLIFKNWPSKLSSLNYFLMTVKKFEIIDSSFLVYLNKEICVI